MRLLDVRHASFSSPNDEKRINRKTITELMALDPHESKVFSYC